ncbi:hypothetical protein S40288_10963 [Stachybotrys chartarum IBT 40288]|nr:hypothetical protein S40288_10963 [Stachybotrys chartarum IBT 40288]
MDSKGAAAVEHVVTYGGGWGCRSHTHLSAPGWCQYEEEHASTIFAKQPRRDTIRAIHLTLTLHDIHHCFAAKLARYAKSHRLAPLCQRHRRAVAPPPNKRPAKPRDVSGNGPTTTNTNNTNVPPSSSESRAKIPYSFGANTFPRGADLRKDWLPACMLQLAPAGGLAQKQREYELWLHPYPCQPSSSPLGALPPAWRALPSFDPRHAAPASRCRACT